MKHILAALKLGPAHVVSFVVVVMALIVLRSFNADSRITMSNVRSTSVTLRAEPHDPTLPFMNETAAARSIVLNGFEVDISQQAAGTATRLNTTLDAASGPVILRRSDQLHIKDLVLRPGTQVVLTYRAGILGMTFSGLSNCCAGRIGVGSSVFLSAGDHRGGPVSSAKGGLPTKTDATKPNLAIRCIDPPCAMTISLQQNSIENLVEDWPATLAGFDRAGTGEDGANLRGESAILGGSILVAATDLLKGSFELRKIDLARGDSIVPAPDGTARVNMDIDQDALSLNGELRGLSHLTLRSRAGEPTDILPTVLEVVLREPWRASLTGIILAAVPFLVGVIQRYRKRLQSRRRKVVRP